MLTRIVLALVSLTSASVIADTPVPFGVRVQPLALMPTDPAPAQIDADLLANVDAAEQAVISMEQRLGPYHPDLTAPLVDAAHLATQSGEIALAASLYDRALHNARVNDGLYGDQQLPILRGLLDLYLVSGDRAAFEERAAYQFRLLGSGVPPFETGELQAALEFFDVSLDALLDVAWEARGRDVLRLHDRFKSMTEEVCADQSVNRDWCEPFTFRLGRFYYLLEYKLDVLVDDPRFESAFGDTEWQSLEREPRLDVLQRRLFGQGEKLFEALLTVDANSPAALSALADWYWFYRKRDRALELYRQACARAPDSFTQAAPLPEHPKLAYELAFQERPIPVRLSVKVSERGQPSDIELTSLDAESTSVPSGLRRSIRKMRYRPALDECKDPIEAMLEMDLVYLE